MQKNRKLSVELGGFRLDANRRLLFREGRPEPIELTSTVFDTLVPLVQNADRAMEKKELMCPAAG
jgi:DNA-binding response OmpR family regulator